MADEHGGPDDMSHERRGPLNRLVDGVVDRVVTPIVTPMVQPVVDAVDVDEVLDQIDVDALLDRVDVNRVLDRVDVDQLLDRVDVDRLLDRVEPNALLDRVDPDRLLDRVDPNRLMDRVDVDGLISRTELRSIIARSTAGVFANVVDIGRAAFMTLDLAAHRVSSEVRKVTPLRSRRAEETPLPHSRSLLSLDRAVALQGQPAGAVSRFAAFSIDAVVVTTTFTLVVVVALTAARYVAGVDWDLADHPLLTAVLLITWQLLYYAGLTAATGRTVGKAVLGLLVTDAGGLDVTAREALVRTITLPLSFLLFGAGFLLGLFRTDRRMLHDLIGRTAVRYEWDAEMARLRAEEVPVTGS